MKIKRFIALTVIALLVVGVTGVIVSRTYAQGTTTPNTTQDTEDPAISPDTDTIDEQIGQQVEDGQPDGQEAASAPDTGVQDPSYLGSITIDQAQAVNQNETDEAAALQNKALISTAEAEAAALAANPDATAVKTELDNENGVLVYSVELSNGLDVKVDAGNGAILFTDSSVDSEG